MRYQYWVRSLATATFAGLFIFILLYVPVYQVSNWTLTPTTEASTAGSGAGCEAGKLCNPLKSKTITQFLLAIIDVILVFALPIIIFFIMFAGFLFVTAQGNQSQIDRAKSALTWAVIGGVIALGAKVIIDVIQGTISAF